MLGRIMVVFFVGIFAYIGIAYAAMSSTNYEIRWDTISTGGADTMSSSTYQLRGTGGEPAGGVSTSASYRLDAGYRGGIFDRIVIFDVMAEESSADLDATSLSGLTITGDTAGLIVGDFIAVVQDEGLSQVVGMGKIVSLGAGTVTVDALKTNGVAPVIDGINDKIYPLTATSMSAGPMSLDTPQTSIIGFNVTIDVDGGYTVQVMEDGDLRSGGNTINDVTDGEVTQGREEYGARTSDASVDGSTFDTQDTAITSDYQEIADESDLIFESRNFLVLKLSTNGNTVGGNYSHTLSFIVSGNY